MSQETVEVVRGFWRAWEGGDLGGVLALVDPDVVTERMHPAPDAQVYAGREGMVQAAVDWIENFGEFVITGEEFFAAGGDQVVVRIHQEATGDLSRVPVSADFWFVHAVRDGAIARLDMYLSKAQAFDAVGLPG